MAIAELCAKYGRDLSITVALLKQAEGRDELADVEIGAVVAGKIYEQLMHWAAEPASLLVIPLLHARH